MSNGDSNDQLVVVTLNPVVFDLRFDFSQPRIEFVRWAELLPARTFGPSSKHDAQQALTNLMSEAEVLSALERALKHAQASERTSAIRMSDIRMHIEAAEPRFKKTHPGANVHGIIGAAIELCEKRGLIAIDRTMDRINYFLWLKAKPEVPTQGNGHTAPPVDPLYPELPLREAEPTAARILPMPAHPGGADDTTSRAVVNSVDGKGERQSRSDQFVDSLIKQQLGPFSRFRNDLYDALKEVVEQGEKSVITVLSATIALTKLRVTDEPGEKPIPWRKVREFLRNIIGRRPVLLSLEGPIAQSFQSLSTQVVSLADNWRLELDGELVVALVRDGLNVHVADLQFIAGALFNDRSEETEARSSEVIEFLLKTRRLEEDANHYLREPKQIESGTRVLTA